LDVADSQSLHHPPRQCSRLGPPPISPLDDGSQRRASNAVCISSIAEHGTHATHPHSLIPVNGHPNAPRPSYHNDAFELPPRPTAQRHDSIIFDHGLCAGQHLGAHLLPVRHLPFTIPPGSTHLVSTQSYTHDRAHANTCACACTYTYTSTYTQHPDKILPGYAERDHPVSAATVRATIHEIPKMMTAMDGAEFVSLTSSAVSHPDMPITMQETSLLALPAWLRAWSTASATAASALSFPTLFLLELDASPCPAASPATASDGRMTQAVLVAPPSIPTTTDIFFHAQAPDVTGRVDE